MNTSNMDKTHEIMLKAGFDYAGSFESGQLTFEILRDHSTVRETIAMVYSNMVDKKKIIPLEKMTPEQKNELWAICKPYTVGLSKEQAIDLSKAVWVLAELAEMKEGGSE